MRDPRQDTTEQPEQIADLLGDRYDLPITAISRLPLGQNTINYRAEVSDATAVFVKHYAGRADLAAEQGAIDLARTALEAGIPGSRALSNRDGEQIDTTRIPISVWTWSTGHVATHPDVAQMGEAGDALGRIHRLFATLPTPDGFAPQPHPWRHADLAHLSATIDRLLAIIADKISAGRGEPFDQLARESLLERRGQLPRLGALLTELPEGLSTQLIHGDYAPLNLLYDGERLAAVLDYSPPRPFLVAYDLGRMAFFPTLVAADLDWPGRAAAFVTAYRQARPHVAPQDVQAGARIALLQLLTSLYGIRQHYLKPEFDQDTLDAFWLERHRAATRLLTQQASTDDLLAELSGR